MKAIAKYARLSLDAALVIFLLLILLSPWNLWFSQQIDLSRIEAPPSWQHPFGTDALGRDQWLRAVNALRETLPILWLSVVLATILGLAVGILRVSWTAPSRFWLPWVKIGEALAHGAHAIPIPVAAFFAMVIYPGDGLLTLAICLAVLVAMRCYFFIQLNFMRSAGFAYWQAHEGVGGTLLGRVYRYGLIGEWRREWLHQLAFHLKVALITEISLSYLGFGVQEPLASFGNLLGAQLQNYLNGDWVLLLGVLGLIYLACEAPFSLHRLFSLWPGYLRYSPLETRGRDGQTWGGREMNPSHRNV